jgi:hypothetical protein
MPEDRLNERDVEELLRGRQPGDHAEWGDVAAWIGRLREASRAQGPPAMNARLRMQMEHAPVSTPSTVLDENRRPVSSPRWASSGGAFARRRWRVAGIAAVAFMLAGVMVGVGLNSRGQPDDLDVRTPSAPQRDGVGSPAEGTEDDVSTEGSVKEPPPPAEPAPTAPPTTAPPSEAPQGSDRDDKGRAGAPGQDRRERGDDEDAESDWQGQVCEWLDEHGGDRELGEQWEELCDADFSQRFGL